MHRDAPDRGILAGALGVDHVAAHLDDEQPAILVDRHGHRIDDQRLGDQRGDGEALLEIEAGQRFGHRQVGSGRDHHAGGRIEVHRIAAGLVGGRQEGGAQDEACREDAQVSRDVHGRLPVLGQMWMSN